MWYKLLVQAGENPSQIFIILMDATGWFAEAEIRNAGFFSDVWQRFGCNYSTQQLTVSKIVHLGRGNLDLSLRNVSLESFEWFKHKS